MLALDKIPIVCILKFLRVSVFVDRCLAISQICYEMYKVDTPPSHLCEMYLGYVGLQVIPQWFHSVGLVTDDA